MISIIISLNRTERLLFQLQNPVYIMNCLYSMVDVMETPKGVLHHIHNAVDIRIFHYFIKVDLIISKTFSCSISDIFEPEGRHNPVLKHSSEVPLR